MRSFDTRDSALRARELGAAIRAHSQTDDTSRGAVFTRPEIAEAILKLAGYEPARPLHRLRLLEPACGGGDFLLPALERLLAAYTAAGGDPERAPADLRRALCAVEIHPRSLDATTQRVTQRLLAWGATPSAAQALCEAWLRCDDFLLTPLPDRFDFVVGNPPYVRLERLPPLLRSEYRRHYRTLYDRADLYIAFFERGLELLAPDARLAFICANRWLKNRYGGPLREYITRGFHLEHVIDLEGADAFLSEVNAYPSITAIHRVAAAQEPQRLTRVVRQPELDPASLARLIGAMRSGGPSCDARIQEVAAAQPGSAPWLLEDADRLGILRRWERQLPELEATGCKVGIGVATGCDAVFIDDHAVLPVEESRKLPLVMAPDLKDGSLRWGGKGVINPYAPCGTLTELESSPRLAAYLRAHEQTLRARHCARKNPQRWYKTIDRIWPQLVTTPKLLIPDIKGEAVVVFDEGRYYPHHNLYHVTAASWDLRALQSVLRSSVALWFVAAYGVKMAGGFLRFQAQYLRRIRIPRWEDVPDSLRQALIRHAENPDLDELDGPVFQLYGLSAQEAETVAAAAAAARVRPVRAAQQATS